MQTPPPTAPEIAPASSVPRVERHTPFEDGQAIFTGDMMHRPIQVAEPEWNSRFCDDAELARKTRRGFLERHADADVIVLAAHFPVAGRIVAPGGRARFQPLAA